MNYVENFLVQFEAWVWGIPLSALLLGGGLYLTFLLRGIQFRYLGYAFKEIFSPIRKGAEGDISPFEALATSLAGAIGTGAIVGVATAVTIGGLGSLFWMWIMAFLGMATKYAESILAVKYRGYDDRGEVIGGPMQYMEKGLGWKKTASLFAVFGVVASFGIGNLVQINAIAEVAYSMCSLDPWVTGFLVALIAAVVVIGGVRSIGHATGILVPVMGLLYVGGGLFVIIAHLDRIPEAFALIFSSAFKGQAAAGGFAGTTLMMAIQTGVSRSVFSNEAGLGAPSIASAAAKTDSPGRQAMVSMVGPLLSTVIVCTITGLVLAVTKVTDLSGASSVVAAFNTSIVGGSYIVSIALVLFAFSTVIAWVYSGEKCFEYLFGENNIIIYRIIFILAIVPAAAIKMEMAWYFANIANGLMAVPNMIAIFALSGVIVSETRTFLKIVKREEAQQLKTKPVHAHS